MHFNTELWKPASPDYVSSTEFPNYNIVVAEEFKWLDKCTDTLPKLDHIYPSWWVSHHASQKRGILTPLGINTIIPLRPEKVSTFDMQSHLMLLNMKWTKTLNLGQTPVDVSGQPVYTLTKQLQLHFPEIFSNYFPLFRQLHIEQCLLVIHGQMIKGSGLLEILTENKFSMIGLSTVADVNNTKRARHTLQITLCSLFNQLREAMSNNLTDLSPYYWPSQKSKDSTSSLYWKCTIDLQVMILLYVRSIQEGNFKLHVKVLSNYLFIFLYLTTATTLVSWLYIGLTCTPSNRNSPICTIIFQTVTFHSKSPTKSFREWGWIKSWTEQ